MITAVDDSQAARQPEPEWVVGDANCFQPSTSANGLHQANGNPEFRKETPSTRTLTGLLYELAVRLPVLTEVQPLCVWLCQPDRGAIRLHVLQPGLPGEGLADREFPLEDSIAGWVWKQARPLVIGEAPELRFPEFARLLHAAGVRSFCALPVMVANRQVSVLALASNLSEAFRGFSVASRSQGATGPGHGPVFFHGSEHPIELENEICDAVPWSAEKPTPEDTFEGIIGRSPAMRALGREVKVVAPTSSTVLILGETGTGKELIARAIHNLSARRERPFIKVNCAAIPAGLIESELFGHERGAFTGAIERRTGRFEMADGGTLFLDEIGDIPLELQPKLLRVLQEQEFERVGGTRTTKVSVRLVAATSRDLPRMVAEREFRGDLYYRLNVFPLRVPALRERPEDIRLLVRHFVEVYSQRMGKHIDEISFEAMEVLQNYFWPGNVRELQNIIERAVILSPGRILRPPLSDLKQFTRPADFTKPHDHEEPTTLKDAEREHIIQALAATGWVLGGPKGAGARLGLPRTSLIGKMKRLGISRVQA